ncbi:MAG: TonB-dependent receptor plug domain-containing protein [Lentisphaeraceae bacterium]|nr:TonB-dependent receptor plug domain-containing protein [Lentisphaeraceae bacterium]
MKILLVVFLFLISELNSQNKADPYAMSFEDLAQLLIVTPSKQAERLDEAPNVAYVITKEQIIKQGFRNLKEALASLPGFMVFHKDQQYVTQMRGIAPNDNNKITFLLNGHNINHVFETEILMGPINLDGLQRIEVVIGPGSVLYGAETLAATVNLITEVMDGVEVIAAAGNFNARSTTLRLGKKWSEEQYLSMFTTWMKIDGYDRSEGEANTWSQFAGTSLQGRVDSSYFTVLEGRYNDWSFQASYYLEHTPELNSSLGGGDQPGRIAVPAHRFIENYRFFMMNKHEWTDVFSSSIKLSYDWKDNEQLREDIRQGHILHQEVFGTDIGLVAITEKHTVQLGVQHQLKLNKGSIVLLNGDPIQYELIDTRAINSLGFYLSDSWQAAEHYKLGTALRLDQDTTLNHKWYAGGRLGLIYTPQDDWTSKLLFNSAIRIPTTASSPLNLRWGPGVPIPEFNGTITSNNLAEKPERLSTLEWQNIIYWNKNRFSVNIFYQYLKDYITWFSPFTNVGDFKGYGGELDWRGELFERFTPRANFSYTHNKFKQTAGESGGSTISAVNDHDDLVAVPTLHAVLGLEYRVMKNVSLDIATQFFTSQVYFDKPRDRWRNVNNHFNLDATLTIEEPLGEDSRLQFVIKNLLNNRDRVSFQFAKGQYTPRGLAAEVRLTYKF